MALDTNALYIGTGKLYMRSFGDKFPKAWAATTAVGLGDILSTTAKGLFKVTVAGTTGASAPVEGSGNITDGTATLVRIPWRDVGNCSELEWTGETEEKEHTDFRGPIPTVDLRVMTLRKGNIRAVLDERTMENLQVFLNGGEITGTAGARKMVIYGAGQWKGQLKFEGENGSGGQGYSENWFIGSLTLNPAKSLKVIGGSDFFGGEMEGRVNLDAHGNMGEIESN